MRDSTSHSFRRSGTAPLDRRDLAPAAEARKRWIELRRTHGETRLEIGDSGPLDLQWVVETLTRAADGVYVLRAQPDVPVKAQ